MKIEVAGAAGIVAVVAVVAVGAVVGAEVPEIRKSEEFFALHRLLAAEDCYSAKDSGLRVLHPLRKLRDAN